MAFAAPLVAAFSVAKEPFARTPEHENCDESFKIKAICS